MKHKPNLNVGKGMRQCFGRLHRVGQNPVVVVPPPNDMVLEAAIAAKMRHQLIIIGETTEGTGVSLMDCQKEAMKTILEGLDKPEITYSM